MNGVLLLRWGLPIAMVLATSLIGAYPLIPLSRLVAAGSEPELQELVDSLPKTVMKPDWNDKVNDWRNYEDDGQVDVIVWADKRWQDAIPKDLKDAIQRGTKESVQHVFTGFTATLSTEIIEQCIDTTDKLQFEPDIEIRACTTIQYNATGADIMWNTTDAGGKAVRGNGTTVAVIDTGIDYNHADLGGGFGASYRVIGGWDWVNNDANPMDDNGHGTHCAGIVGANGTVVGMAPDCDFLAYKVLNAGGTGSMSDAVLAIERAMDPNDDDDTSDHADVLSMSFGAAGGSEDSASCLAIDAATEVGCICVVAAGNEGPTFCTVSIPGKARTAITVGSHGQTDALSSFSSRGMSSSLLIKPEICAPGEAIYSTYLYSGYASMSGTSMACPHVAGAAALAVQAQPSWTPSMVKSALVSKANLLNESIWEAGAGKLWVGNISDTVIFSSPAILSGNKTFAAEQSVTISTTEVDVNLTTSSEDWHELNGNYTQNETRAWHPIGVDVGVVLPATTNPTLSTPSTVTLNITEPSVTDPEGYYGGYIELLNDSMTIRIPYAYAVIAVVNIHVYGLSGDEITDAFGKVWLYDNETNLNVRIYEAATIGYAPPVTAQLTSGTYVVHAAGHMLYYTYSDTYILTKEISVVRGTDQDAFIYMMDANQFTLNLTTVADRTLFLQDFRMYWRHIGPVNLSAHYEITDYTYNGPDLFTLPKHRTLYISDTNDTIGIAMNAYGYSDAMWDFMESNYDHWYEYVSGLSTDFEVTATADEQYMLAWEFDAINTTVNKHLGIEWENTDVYQMATDLPGTITDPWLDWGEHRAIGATAERYVRRDTSTSVEPFFTGLNKTLYVQGVQELLHYPTYLIGSGNSLGRFYDVDWDHLRQTTSANVQVVDRNYLTSLAQANATLEIGKGPLWVSASFNNTADQMRMFLPMFMEDGLVASLPLSNPMMHLYRGNSIIAYIALSEIATSLPTMRVFSTTTAGTYTANIPTIETGDVMSTVTSVSARWTTPSSDYSPPCVTNFAINRSFVPGEVVSLSMTVYDDQAIGSAAIDWRNGSADSWHSVSLTPAGLTYSGAIATGALNETIDLRVNVTDATGNYFTYTMLDVSKEEIAVSFDLSTTEEGIPQIPYTNQEQTLTLYGNLTSGGNPLHPQACVPLDLTIDGVKVATILDEFVEAGSHTHNGTIRFEWDFNPIHIFSGAGQSKNVVVNFSLGIYEQIIANFTINSTIGTDIPPEIILVSPTNESDLINGTPIDLDIFDEEALVVNYSLNDELTNFTLSFPYVIDTTSWLDGENTITVRATDSNTTSTAQYVFQVDTLSPVVSVTYPSDLGTIEAGETVTISAADNSTFHVHWSIDGGAWVRDYPTYGLSTAGWAVGWYNATVRAYDEFGHYAEDSVQFYISGLAPLITNSPSTTGTVAVAYAYNASCTAADSGANAWALTTNATWLAEYWSDQTNCLVNGTPTDAGWFWANLSVDDSDSGDYINWTITVTGASPPPTITSTYIGGAREDFLYSYDAEADQPVTWALVSNASFLSIVEATGVLSGTPTNAYSEASYYANVSCTNDNGTAYENFSLSVWNKGPAITSYPETSIAVFQIYQYAADHDDEGVGTPNGNFTGIETNYTGSYTFDEATGALSLTPEALGSYWFNITADDQRGVANSTATQNWTLSVNVGGLHTIITSGLTAAGEDSAYYYDADANQTVTWSVDSDAPFISIDSGTGEVTGTPTNAHAEQSYYVNVSSTSINGTVNENITITVWNSPPTITSTPGTTGTIDALYSYDANHDDEGVGGGDFAPISTNYTDAYAFDEATGVLSFTPTTGGSYWFDITADDQAGVANSTVSQNWTVTIASVVVPDPEPELPSSGTTLHAAFSYVVIGNIVQCTDKTHGKVDRWLWSFGDSTGSEEQNPTHRYDSAGIYTIRLTVYAESGTSSTASTTIGIQLGEYSPLLETDEGWEVYLGFGLKMDVATSAVLVVGLFVAASAMVPLPLLTGRIRLVIGLAMIGISIYHAGGY